MPATLLNLNKFKISKLLWFYLFLKEHICCKYIVHCWHTAALNFCMNLFLESCSEVINSLNFELSIHNVISVNVLLYEKYILWCIPSYCAFCKLMNIKRCLKTSYWDFCFWKVSVICKLMHEFRSVDSKSFFQIFLTCAVF